MKNSTLILGAVATAFVAASIYLGSQLSAARADLEREVQARGADAARIRQLEAERRRLELALSTAGSTPPPAAPVGTTPPLARERQTAYVANSAAAPATAGADRLNNVYNTPAGLNTRRLQAEVRLRRVYADMPAALGLDDGQADKLFNLLAENRVTSADQERAYDGDRTGRQAIETAAREQRDASIEALLGPDKAAEFQSFEQSIPARMQVGRIGESMAAANVPLSDAQRQSLITAVAGELQSGPPPQRAADGSGNADYETRYLDWQSDYSNRVQARVEPLLNSEQVARYREAVQVQNARRADSRARAEARRNTAPGQGRD